MSDDLSPDERKVRALTRAELELTLAAKTALIERDRFIVELLDEGRSTPTPIARAMNRHVSRVRQIRNQWPTAQDRWARERTEIEAEIAALGDN